MKMEYVSACAPGKINLALRVGQRRPDGFHDLDTVFEAVDIFDDVQVYAADGLSLSVTGLGADLPTDSSNIVIRAAKLLQERFGVRGGAKIELTKRIPVAGGMAGGSADAAAALTALNELWELGLSASELRALGAELGSDVPFALLGGIAHGTGRGEKLTALRPGALHGWVILANPDGLSTPEVFRAFDRHQYGSECRAQFPGAQNTGADRPADTKELRRAVQGKNLAAVGAQMKNDLLRPALSLRPDLADIFRKIGNEGYGTILSGSGASVAVLVSAQRLHAHTADLRRRFPGLRVFSAAGPAAGAHIKRSR